MPSNWGKHLCSSQVNLPTPTSSREHTGVSHTCTKHHSKMYDSLFSIWFHLLLFLLIDCILNFLGGPISFLKLTFHCRGFPTYNRAAPKPEIYFYHHWTQEISYEWKSNKDLSINMPWSYLRTQISILLASLKSNVKKDCGCDHWSSLREVVRIWGIPE